MKATITDVATLCGVSIKTVSRVINNEHGVRLKTREKVQQAINELNYQPNFSARNLAGRQSYTIAYIYDNPNAYYVVDTQEGILNSCRNKGFELVICPCDSTQQHINDVIIKEIKKARVAGIVLTPPFSENIVLIKQLINLKVAVVRIISGDKTENPLTPCVMIDDKSAAFDITEHLIKLGHQNIAFIAGNQDHHSTQERFQGFRLALLKYNLRFNDDNLIAGEYSFESGVNSAKQLLTQQFDKELRPTAIFSCNDEIAAGVLFTARLMNIKVPEQLSITGFENSPFSRQTWPTLTTANQPNKQIAHHATDLLINQIQEPTQAQQTCQYIPQLLVRNSTTKSFLNK